MDPVIFANKSNDDVKEILNKTFATRTNANMTQSVLEEVSACPPLLYNPIL